MLKFVATVKCILMVAIFTTSINNDMNNTLFRASQLGKLMTDARTKSGLSETTKSALLEVYIQQRYNRYKEMLIKDDETGLVVNVPDIKSSWDIHTFMDAKQNDISKDYYWQGQAYCWLTGAPRATFCYVLVSAPIEMINDEKYRLSRRLNLIDPQGDPTFLKKAKSIERNMIYDMPRFLREYPDANLETPGDEWAFDIPIAERIHEKVVEFDADAIAKLQERVPMWREYLNTLAL